MPLDVLDNNCAILKMLASLSPVYTLGAKLAHLIAAFTPHESDSIWIRYPYPNGIAFESDPIWILSHYGLM